MGTTKGGGGRGGDRQSVYKGVEWVAHRPRNVVKPEGMGEDKLHYRETHIAELTKREGVRNLFEGGVYLSEDCFFLGHSQK